MGNLGHANVCPGLVAQEVTTAHHLLASTCCCLSNVKTGSSAVRRHGYG